MKYENHCRNRQNLILIQFVTLVSSRTIYHHLLPKCDIKSKKGSTQDFNYSMKHFTNKKINLKAPYWWCSLQI